MHFLLSYHNAWDETGFAIQQISRLHLVKRVKFTVSYYFINAFV